MAVMTSKGTDHPVRSPVGRRARLRWSIVAVGAVVGLLGVLVLVAALVGTGARRLHMGTEVPVTAVNQAVGPANNSPALAADPTNGRFVVMANRTDAPDFGCFLQVSGDGGKSWITARPVPRLPAGAEKCYAPEVAFDGRGVLYYLFVGLAGRGNRPMGAFLATSTDRARSFSAPRLILGPLNFSVRMAIDRDMGTHGRIHLVWVHATSDPGLGAFGPPPNPILTSYSDDGGRTFSVPVQVSDANRLRVVGPALSLGPNHRVYIAYYDLGRDAVDYEGLGGPTWDGKWSMVLAASFDGGVQFGPETVVDDSIAPPGRVMLIFTMPPPSLVADGREVCAAWTDARFGDPDALLRCSGDGGRTWQPPRRLNDDPVGDGRDQELPRLALSPGGRVDAIFLDRRGDVFNSRYDVMYTYSTDGGRRFFPDRKLTSESSDVTVGAQYVGAAAAGLVEHGSRLALLSRSWGVLAAWPDTRNATDAQRQEQDVLATDVRLPAGGHVRGGWVWTGVLLVVAGSLTALWGERQRKTGGAIVSVAGGQAVGADAGIADRAHRAGRWRVLAASAAIMIVVAVVAYRHIVAGRARDAALPASPPVVDVTITDHGYLFDHTIPHGRVIFRVHNATRTDHRMGLYPWPESFPPVDQQLHGTVRRLLPDAVAELSTRKPGQSQLAAVDLVPHQRYAVLDLLHAPDRQVYALKGLDAEFRAT